LKLIYNKDFLASVQAALKLLITSMDDDFYVDVMSFTTVAGTDCTPELNPIFGSLTTLVSKSNREELNTKIYEFVATNGTPTREALLYGLRNYTDATDIVLLTDGVPYYDMDSSGEFTDDEVDNELVNAVTQSNSIGAAIHTIIVGEMCPNNTDKDRLEQMMIELANRNNGKSIRLK